MDREREREKSSTKTRAHHERHSLTNFAASRALQPLHARERRLPRTVCMEERQTDSERKMIWVFTVTIRSEVSARILVFLSKCKTSIVSLPSLRYWQRQKVVYSACTLKTILHVCTYIKVIIAALILASIPTSLSQQWNSNLNRAHLHMHIHIFTSK